MMSRSVPDYVGQVFSELEGRASCGRDSPEYGYFPGHREGPSAAPGAKPALNKRAAEVSQAIRELESRGFRVALTREGENCEEVRVVTRNAEFVLLLNEKYPVDPPRIFRNCDGVEIEEDSEWEPGTSVGEILDILVRQSDQDDSAGKTTVQERRVDTATGRQGYRPGFVENIDDQGRARNSEFSTPSPNPTYEGTQSQRFHQANADKTENRVRAIKSEKEGGRVPQDRMEKPSWFEIPLTIPPEPEEEPEDCGRRRFLGCVRWALDPIRFIRHIFKSDGSRKGG